MIGFWSVFLSSTYDACLSLLGVEGDLLLLVKDDSLSLLAVVWGSLGVADVLCVTDGGLCLAGGGGDLNLASTDSGDGLCLTDSGGGLCLTDGGWGLDKHKVGGALPRPD